MIALCDYNIGSIIFLEGCVMENQQQETVVESTPVVETVAEAPVVAERVPQKSGAVIAFSIIAMAISLVFVFLPYDTFMGVLSWACAPLRIVSLILIMVGMGKTKPGATFVGGILMMVAALAEVGLWYMSFIYVPMWLVGVAIAFQALALALVAKDPTNAKKRKVAKIAFIIAIIAMALRAIMVMIIMGIGGIISSLLVLPLHLFIILALKKATNLR